jgi:DNA primase
MDPLHPVFPFIYSRRYTPYLLNLFGAQYCNRGKNWKRLIFPFFGPGGEYRGFQGRYIYEPVPESVPKWSTALGTEKSKMLWNFERVLERQNWCVLVEGIFDAMRMKDWAVAMLGKTPSDTQKALLEYFQHIFIMLDSDATDTAYRAARDLVDDAAFRVTVVELEEGDPDDHEFEELGSLVQASAPRDIAADLEVFCR